MEIFNIKDTDSKKVICNLCSNEFLRGGSNERVFSFDFNARAVCLIKRICSL